MLGTSKAERAPALRELLFPALSCLWISHCFPFPLLQRGPAQVPGEGEGGAGEGWEILWKDTRSSKAWREAVPARVEGQIRQPFLWDVSSLSVPRHKTTLGLIAGNPFIWGSPGSLCVLLCSSGRCPCP